MLVVALLAALSPTATLAAPGTAPGAAPAAPGTTPAAPGAPQTGAPQQDTAPPHGTDPQKTLAPLPELTLPLRPPSPAAATRAAQAHAAHAQAGRSAAARTNWLDARRHFEAALLLDPQDPDLLTQLAEALLHSSDRGRAIATLRRAIELTDERAPLAARHITLARLAEHVEDHDTARLHYHRATSLSPSPDATARLAALEDTDPLDLMSPLTFCPQLADAWGCAPPSRPGDGGLRCLCTIERQIEAPEAITGGVLTRDAQGITHREPHVLVAAALLRIKGTGIGRLDAAYLVVETGSGGWQLVGRVEEGWQPGAAYVGRAGRVTAFGFRETTDTSKGRILTVRADDLIADGDFRRNRTTETRQSWLWICHAIPAPSCVRIPVARRHHAAPMRADEPPPPPADLAPADWSLDATLGDDATLAIRPLAGTLPPALAALVGRRALPDLATLAEPDPVWIIPLR